MDIKEFAAKLDLINCVELDPSILIPDERVRSFCADNKCGSYGKNYTCPPHIGTLEEINEKLRHYSEGYLVQYARDMDVSLGNLKNVVETKNEFHRKVLRLEKFLLRKGVKETWGLIGGNCGLCKICAVNKDKPCRHPERARPSLESIGIDVMSLLKTLKLEGEFRKDRVTWTGCVLYNR